MASIGGQSGLSATKITKARGKMVKPILKKLAHTHSEKNSLDLDRGWEEQQVEQLEVGGGWDGGFGYGQARDGTGFGFGFAGAGGIGVGEGIMPVAMGPGAGAGGSIRGSSLKFQHGRSGSQTSAGSGPRGGAFVHPFAQTPRTSTPPLSYANSLASFDNGRDCSPTITENEDDDGFDTSTTYPPSHSLSHAHSTIAFSQPPAPGASQSNLRRPSLNSQRTSSYTETPSNPPSLRITTGRSVSGAAATTSRFAHGSLPAGSLPTCSSDLQLNAPHSLSVSVGTDTLDSPTGSLGAGSIIAQQSQLSPLRTSLDMAGFPRLRSRSELDSAAHVENVRAARRKFEEREKVKEEKYDREMIRKRERRDNKEALRIEKGEPPNRPTHRKKTLTGLSTVSEPGGGSGSRSSRIDLPLHATPPHRGFSAPVGGLGLGIGRRRQTDPPTPMAEREKPMGFAARRYETVSLQTPPAFGVTVDDVHFEQARPRRGSSAKRKTQGYWQGFLLWLRTKLLRMGSAR